MTAVGLSSRGAVASVHTDASSSQSETASGRPYTKEELLQVPVADVICVPSPGLQPQALVDARGVTHLVYLKGKPDGCDVFYRTREPKQAEFGPAIQVNSQPAGAIAIGTVRGAQFALGRNGTVHAVWNGSQAAKAPGAKSVPLLYSRLNDSAKRFEPQRNLMTGTINLDGGGSVAADRQGNVYVVWHAHAASLAEPDEMNRAVYLARSSDDGRTFAQEQKISGPERGVCACCALKAFTDPKDRLGVMYRSADDKADRDMRLLVSRDQGHSFKSMLLGEWHISTCPMSTQALTAFDENTWIAAWETEGQIFYAAIDPERLEFKLRPTPVSGNPGNRKHPSLGVHSKDPGPLLLSWAEGTGWERGGTLAWELIELKPGNLGPRAKVSSSTPGAPIAAWGSACAVAGANGSFSILY